MTLPDFAELRQARALANIAFYRLWRRKVVRDNVPRDLARRKGYAWLAGQLEIPVSECDILSMDLDQCRRVLEVCRPYQMRPA